METTYRVLIKGTKPGADTNLVRENITKLFRISDEDAGRVLAAKTYVVKGGLTMGKAAQYHTSIEAAGANCIVEPETPIDLDLQLASPVSEKLTERNNSKALVADKNQLSSEGILQGFGALIFLILTGYAVYQFIQFVPAFSNLTAPPSLLEKISIIGKSTRVEFENFKDSGGLDHNPSWHGLNVTAYQAVYNGPSKTLSGQTFSITGKATWNAGIKMWTKSSQLSTQELRQILSQVCQASEDKWKFTDGNHSYGTVESSNFQCSYGPSDHGSYEIFVGSIAAR